MKYLFLLAIVASHYASAQLLDDFSDGNFSSSPSWYGDTNKFFVNNQLQLQSASVTINDRFFLSTAQHYAFAQWSFYVKLDFATSSANYIDIYLIASDSHLLSPPLTGYFVRLGGAHDEVSLFRKDSSGSVCLIDGLDGSISGSTNELRILVTRGPDYTFTLWHDVGLTSRMFMEQSSIDSTYRQSSFMGVLVQQSASSFFQKHYFDDFEISPFIPDTIKPLITSVFAKNDSVVIVHFSEAVNSHDALNSFHYEVNRGVGFPRIIEADVFDARAFHLTFFNTLPQREELRLYVTDIADISGNYITDTTIVFSYLIPQYADVLITEIMADPTPVVQLPEAEWIELYNASGTVLNLEGWRLCKNSQGCLVLPPYLLAPQQYVVLTSTSRINEFEHYEHVLGISGFPSLNNSGDLLSIHSPQGVTIHAVKYSETWYADEFKKNGGFSLEMIDITKPCLQAENWKSSVSSIGGTPSQTNSIYGTVALNANLRPIRVSVLDSMHIEVWFNQSVDSLSAMHATFSINEDIGGFVEIKPVAPLFMRIQLTLARALAPLNIYTITITGIRNCGGEMAQPEYSLRVGLPVSPTEYEIIINEILFNPHPGEVDYVELYHKGNAPVDLYYLFLANRNTSGAVSSIARISQEHFLFFPGDFMVVTENPDIVQQRYVTPNRQYFISLFTPSWPDDRGNVVLINNAGELVDELAYNKSWHYPLLSNAEGVSLERINYNKPTQDFNNWHSASSTVGYGTPGYENSQMLALTLASAEITISPQIISPDNDGRDDFAIIQYSFPQNGFLATVSVFDYAGRMVRQICRNQLCGIVGFWKWDGLREKQEPLPTGRYILYVETLHPSGKSAKFKRAIVLASK